MRVSVADAAPIAETLTIGEADAGFGIYVHWPFCQAKCPYCDFNSHVVARIDQKRWANALAQDVRRSATLTPERKVTSVFFGGGTPSTMEPETVAQVMRAIHESWTCATDMEVSLEANPTSSDAARFSGFRAAGVTRLSLGVQALNDRDLRRLGRLHDVAEARAAFAIARKTFDRVSFDLICARQDQTREAWQAELTEALEMAVDHISLYQLTIEPGTAFAQRAAIGGLPGLPDEDLGADLYEITVERCAEAGLALYEVSNFARSNAECKHNILYWSAGDYVGVGPGAHGRLTLGGVRSATEQVSAPGDWLSRVEGDRSHETVQALSIEDQTVEYLMMGLRKRDGLCRDILAELRVGEAIWSRIDKIAGMGLLDIDATRVRATDRGRLLLNWIVTELIAE